MLDATTTGRAARWVRRQRGFAPGVRRPMALREWSVLPGCPGRRYNFLHFSRSASAAISISWRTRSTIAAETDRVILRSSACIFERSRTDTDHSAPVLPLQRVGSTRLEGRHADLAEPTRERQSPARSSSRFPKPRHREIGRGHQKGKGASGAGRGKAADSEREAPARSRRPPSFGEPASQERREAVRAGSPDSGRERWDHNSPGRPRPSPKPSTRRGAHRCRL